MWQHLVDNGVASHIHKYDEPAWQHYVPPNIAPERMNKSFFDAKCSKAPAWLSRIVSSKNTTDWFSTTPTGHSIVFADIFLMTVAHKQHKWNEIAQGAGFSKLAAGDRLLLQAPEGGEWYFSMGDIAGIAALGWPAEVRWASGQPQQATPRLNAKCVMLAIFSGDWQAVPRASACLPLVAEGAFPIL